MIRTRGLCQALGRILGRTLGRQVVGDEEEAPQSRRATTSARRQ